MFPVNPLSCNAPKVRRTFFTILLVSVEALQFNGLIFQTNITGIESIYVCIGDIVHEYKQVR